MTSPRSAGEPSDRTDGFDRPSQKPPTQRKNLWTSQRSKLRQWATHALKSRELHLWTIPAAIEVVHDELGFRPSRQEMVNAFGRAWEDRAVNGSAKNADPRDRPIPEAPR